jgi:hypothetical protein
MAWTTPRTWVTSEVVTATIMNTHVRDNLEWLAGFGIGGTDFGSLAAQHTSISRVAVGTYSGNATDDRGITGVGFQPVAMFIKSATTYEPVWRWATTGDLSGFMNANAPQANLIQSLDSDGFTIGDNVQVNANGVTHYYVCWG